MNWIDTLPQLPEPIRMSAGEPYLIVDVGAQNLEGQDHIYSPMRRRLDCHVIGFEPLDEERDKRVGEHNITLLPDFIGDGTESLFHINNYNATSSLIPSDMEVMGKYVGLPTSCATESIVSIHTRRLDGALREALGTIPICDFLKVDVQGAECDVFRGAEETLSRTLCVFSEVEFVPIYKDQPLFADVDSMLRAKSFQFIDFYEHGYCRYQAFANAPTSSALLWANALYLRHEDSVDDSALLRMASIAYYNFGKIDLAAHYISCYDQRSGTAFLDEFKTTYQKLTASSSVTETPTFSQRTVRRAKHLSKALLRRTLGVDTKAGLKQYILGGTGTGTYNIHIDYNERSLSLSYWMPKHRQDPLSQSIMREDPHLFQEPLALFPYYVDPSPGTFIDIGANIGIWSLVNARMGYRVFAFEAGSENCRILNRAAELNKLTNMTVINKAVTDRSKTLRFLERGPWGHILEDDEPYDPVKDGDTPSTLSTIEATSLDDWNSNHNVTDVSMVKIDIEGGEVNALRGMKRFLEANSWPPVYCEVNGWCYSWTKLLPQDLFALGHSYGYEIFIPEDGKRLIRVNIDRVQPNIIENYLLVHRDSILLNRLPIANDLRPLEQEFFDNAFKAEDPRVLLYFALVLSKRPELLHIDRGRALADKIIKASSPVLDEISDCLAEMLAGQER